MGGSSESSNRKGPEWAENKGDEAVHERSESGVGKIRCGGSEPRSWAGVSHSIPEVAAWWVAWRRLCRVNGASPKEAVGA